MKILKYTLSIQGHSIPPVELVKKFEFLTDMTWPNMLSQYSWNSYDIDMKYVSKEIPNTTFVLTIWNNGTTQAIISYKNGNRI